MEDFHAPGASAPCSKSAAVAEPAVPIATGETLEKLKATASGRSHRDPLDDGRPAEWWMMALFGNIAPNGSILSAPRNERC